MIEKLKNDMVLAMKNQDKERLTVIRMVKSAIDLEHIDKKRELNDELFLDVINKQIKMRRDSLAEFEKANREDLINQTKQEISILKEYLPAQLSKEEVKKIAEECKVELGITDIKGLGALIKAVKAKVGVGSDGKTISDVAKEILNN